MLIGDHKPVRSDRLDPSSFASAPPLEVVPEHLFVDTIGESRAARLRRLVPSTAISIVVHLALAVAFVILWRSMIQDLTSSEPISVEVVNSIPGESHKTDRNGSPTGKPDATPQKNPEPKPPPAREAKPDALPPVPGTQATAPAQQPGPEPSKPRSPASTDPAKASQPALVAPPPEPARAATQSEKNQKSNASEDRPKTPAPAEAVKPAQAPKVLTAPQSDNTVPLPSAEPNPPPPKQPQQTDPDQHAAADPNAALAAALPMSPIGLPSTFRAMLSSAGQSGDQEYKGVVFGMVGRVKGVAALARQHRLKNGFVILSINIADSGAIDTVSVVQSSGNPDLDRGIVDLIRRQGPLPPPPPGAQRAYTPAISFGEN